MKRLLVVLCLSLMLASCGEESTSGSTDTSKAAASSAVQTTSEKESQTTMNSHSESTISSQESEKEFTMRIADTKVNVEWEDNDSVAALKQLAAEKPLTIDMSMYGGFEQVGGIGKTLPSDDKKIKTEAGDIVLYSSDQIVVFYGSNTWEYTRLGKVKDLSKGDLKDLLSNGDVTITISFE